MRISIEREPGPGQRATKEIPRGDSKTGSPALSVILKGGGVLQTRSERPLYIYI